MENATHLDGADGLDVGWTITSMSSHVFREWGPEPGQHLSEDACPVWQTENIANDERGGSTLIQQGVKDTYLMARLATAANHRGEPTVVA